MRINILAPEVANQIAAGEVVERPASVVKELLENSLDAGAREMRVEIREGGQRLIRVRDDGTGIAAEDIPLVFTRHATSKIRAAADLERIQTLGFRGEALASIASVAHTSLLTRTEQERAGRLVRLVEGREVANEPAGAPAGTTFTVEHIFQNVPARRKFLKQPATEAGHILQVVTRYALAYPDRRFELVSDDRLLFRSTGSGQRREVLEKVLGGDLARQMIELAQPDAGAPVQVSGFVSPPHVHRSNRSHLTLFVNRRSFGDTSLAYAVIQAYSHLLPTGRYPLAVIFIDMDPGDVDVNVHPTKAEVRFRDSGSVFRAVGRAVRAALGDSTIATPSTLTGPPVFGQGQGRDAGWMATAGDRQATWGEAAWERRQTLLQAGHGMQMPSAGGAVPQAPLLPERALLLRVVGQVGAAYIVAEGPDGLYLIDQHAAHERILFERMSAQREQHKIDVQPLLQPLPLELTPQQATVLAEETGNLLQLGVEVEPFGQQSYLIRAVPGLLSGHDPAAAIVQILDELAQGDDPVEGAHEAQLITLICKRAAIKAGQAMSMPEMQGMVSDLERCATPHTCPHGRPTLIVIAPGDLARRFGRV